MVATTTVGTRMATKPELLDGLNRRGVPIGTDKVLYETIINYDLWGPIGYTPEVHNATELKFRVTDELVSDGGISSVTYYDLSATTLDFHITVPEYGDNGYQTQIYFVNNPFDFVLTMIIEDGAISFATDDDSDLVDPYDPSFDWFRIETSGNDVSLYGSSDGVTWIHQTTITRTTDSFAASRVRIYHNTRTAEPEEDTYAYVHSVAIGGVDIPLTGSFPLDTPDSTDWHLVVERLEGDSGSVWGVGEYDATPAWTWGSLEWNDITADVRGMSWTRGSQEPSGRPMVGEITVTLDVSQNTSYDPFQDYGNTRPGTIMRAGLVSASDVSIDGWIPLWTGIVDDWPPVRTGEGATLSGYVADHFATVTLVETLSELAQTNNNALGVAEGAGDNIWARVDRLLTAAGWRYGMAEPLETDDPATYDPQDLYVYTLQSTDMADNRLSELYLAADSTDTIVRSDRTGAAVITGWGWLENDKLELFTGRRYMNLAEGDSISSFLGWNMSRDTDSIITVNSAEQIINDHRYARVGGTQQNFEHSTSIGRFGRKTRSRSDLQTTNDAMVLEIAEKTNIREARTALRLDNVTITATGRPIALLLVALLDVGHDVDVYYGYNYATLIETRLRSMTHTITPMQGAVHWVTNYGLTVTSVDITGAMLDPQP